ncbi:hypothetical protein ABW19_dt0210391 [Dactylella cylindrospora]|nr:hypothetical protein ABW19_dt0210391 [Dactylella cylindrospora]
MSGSRNNSSSNLRKETSTPNSLVEFPQLRDNSNNPPTATTPGIPSRDSSPAIPQSSQAGPINRRVSSAKEVRRELSPSPARSLSSTSIARLATTQASQSPSAVAQTSSGTTSQPTASSTEQQQQQPLSPRPQRPINPNVPHWPTSPRLSLSRSPPPTVRSPSITSPRRQLDSNLTLPPPSMAVRDRESPGRGRSGDESGEGSSYFHHVTHRPPRPIASPAPLETVTEASLPSTPAVGMGNKSIDARLTEAEQRRHDTSSMSTRPSESSISSRTAPESESDTGNLSDRKPPSRAPSRTVSRRPTIKGQDASGDMRAEIETVTSIPQQQINTGSTVRLQRKTSQETIRPPKEKKKKQKRSNPGPNAQAKKAEFFERRINDTLDDAESSDSEETFVYESNPADKRPRHSRASSVTSISDPRRQALDNTQQKTRKMKFGTNHGYKSNHEDPMSDGPGSSTIRGPGAQSSIRSHIGRGYTNPNLDDSTHPQVRHAHHKGSHQSLRSGHITGSRNSSRPTSPRNYVGRHAGTNGSIPPSARREASKISMYEGDIEGDADETTPLFTLHGRHGERSAKSRSASMSRQQLEYNYNRQRNWYARIACCVFAVFVMLSLVSFALGFVFLTTKPLVDLKLVNITDVIATKQEMMFNMDVRALNPNILPVTISTMDVNVFIKSPYVKDKPEKKPDDDDDDDGGWWKSLGSQLSSTTERRRKSKPDAVHSLDGVDEGTDPIKDPKEEEETMLLGRIFNFDSALVFEGSPFHQIPTHAIGEVRLSKPGNKTEVGGSERWERAMLHTFDLTVRGFLRYQLPLSGRVRTATVQGTVTVHPNEDTEEGFKDHTGYKLEFHDHNDQKTEPIPLSGPLSAKFRQP